MPNLLLSAVIIAAATAAVSYFVRKRVLPAPARRPAIGRPSLLLPNGIRVELGDVNIFGRETFLELGIPPDIAKYISRWHFAIKRYGDAYYIEDLGSKNGTYLNGVLIKCQHPQRLKDGDVINVGKVLELRYMTSATSLNPPAV